MWNRLTWTIHNKDSLKICSHLMISSEEWECDQSLNGKDTGRIHATKDTACVMRSESPSRRQLVAMNYSSFRVAVNILFLQKFLIPKFKKKIFAFQTGICRHGSPSVTDIVCIFWLPKDPTNSVRVVAQAKNHHELKTNTEFVTSNISTTE